VLPVPLSRMVAPYTMAEAPWPDIGTEELIPATNPLERLTAEIKRRTAVVGVFPNDRAILRLVGAVLMEQHNDWAAHDRRYLAPDTDPDIGDHPRATLASPRAMASPGSAGSAR